MAQRRIRYERTKSPEAFEPPSVYANFMADLLAGKITPTKLVETKDARGNLALDYDDPSGTGPRAQSEKDER
jgi:hypothetical protein